MSEERCRKRSSAEQQRHLGERKEIRKRRKTTGVELAVWPGCQHRLKKNQLRAKEIYH